MKSLLQGGSNMPRTNHIFFDCCSRRNSTSSVHGVVPGHVWHISHRYHQKEFLLKFRKDRRYWFHCLFEAKKLFGLCVLNDTVTSNHIHLWVKDNGGNAIAGGMQLIAGGSGGNITNVKKLHWVGPT
jgi:hypothetical protein